MFQVIGNRVAAAAVLAALAGSGCVQKAAAQAGGEAAAGGAVTEAVGPRIEADGSIHVQAATRAFVEVRAVRSGANAGAVRAPGRVAFRDGALAQVGAPIAGRVVELRARVGDRVQTGDALAVLASPEALALRAELTRARVAVTAARDAARRQRTMVARGVGIEADRVAAELRLAEAQADLRRAEQTASLLGEGEGERVTVRAPIDGTVLARSATVGATVDPGSAPLVELGDPADVHVVVDIFERDLALVAEGAEVTLAVASLAAPVTGRVARIGSTLSGQRRAEVFVALDPPVPAVRPGTYVRATLLTRSEGLLSVPSAAVLVKGDGQTIVYVEREDGAFVAREVQVGPVIDGAVQVLSGLTAGESVLVEGALLIDGLAGQLL